MPMTCTGSPSAEARSRLSPVITHEVARHVEHRRAPRTQQRVFHLAHDSVETVGDDGEQDWIETHDAAIFLAGTGGG